METRLHLVIDGMSDGQSVHAVEEALRRVAGVEVTSVVVGAAEVTLDPERVSVDRVLDAVNDEGYVASAEPMVGM